MSDPRSFRIRVRDIHTGELVTSELMDRGRLRRFMRQLAGGTVVVNFRRFPSGELVTIDATTYELVVDCGRS